MTRFIIIRHGQTQWNLEGREIGQLDSPLTPLGERQAVAVAQKAEKSSPDILYSSDLGRALQTAQVIASKTKREILIDVRLRERHMGIFQGLTIAEMEQQYPEERAAYRRDSATYVVPGGGESGNQRIARTVACLNELAERHSGKQVMIVTHTGVLVGFFEYVLNLPYGSKSRYCIPNAAWNSFLKTEKGWKLETWADISHLDGIYTD